MEELNGSELGTYQYWKDAYKKEIKNFDEHGDFGEVWFGEDSVHRVVQWLCRSNLITRQTPIIDLGCGNGFTLIELASEGFVDLTGVDYCPEAIALAQKIASEKYPLIKYKVFNILVDSVASLGQKYGVIHDKGTYDAISLMPEDPGRNRQEYISRIPQMLTDDGIFVITTCNWTEEEIVKHFTTVLDVKAVIPTPSFRYGGKVGSVVTSVVFSNK